MGNFFLSAVQLMRADKPVGTVLLASPMLWALWLASPEKQPSAQFVLIFLIGAFVMRSAGCVINDYADYHIDSKVKRTKDRPLTAERISKEYAVSIFIALVLVAIVLLCLLPPTAVAPAFLAFFLSAGYPFSKRFFVIPQLILGLAFSTSILMAYIVVTGTIPLSGWLLFIASTLWTVVYDTFYAMVDRDDDQHLGIHSSALWFSDKDLKVCLLLSLCFVILMLTIGVINALSGYYYLGLALASLCFVYQFWVSRSRERDVCFKAFLNNQWVGVLIFLGILLDSLP